MAQKDFAELAEVQVIRDEVTCQTLLKGEENFTKWMDSIVKVHYSEETCTLFVTKKGPFLSADSTWFGDENEEGVDACFMREDGKVLSVVESR